MTNYLKKHLLFIVLFCIILFALLFILLFNKSNNDIISNDNNIVNNTNNGMFAIMLETEAGSGEYQESTSSTWPGDGYIFNENLSVCENGSELTWNEELGAVNLKTNIADRCFVYFDVYVLPEILEVTASDITSNSITLTVNAIAGTSNISTYYYSIDNGNSWISSASNSYTFTNLASDTEYNLQVYTEDSNGKKSDINILDGVSTLIGSVEIISYNLSLSHGANNYLLNVVVEPEVEIAKYVLKLSNGNIMEINEQGYNVWPSYNDNNQLNFNPYTTYSYSFYVVTSSGIKSNVVQESITTDGEKT